MRIHEIRWFDDGEKWRAKIFNSTLMSKIAAPDITTKERFNLTDNPFLFVGFTQLTDSCCVRNWDGTATGDLATHIGSESDTPFWWHDWQQQTRREIVSQFGRAFQEWTKNNGKKQLSELDMGCSLLFSGILIKQQDFSNLHYLLLKWYLPL